MRARTLEELIDVGLLLDRQPAPAGPRVALIGNAGGALLLGADAAGAGGLVVGVLSPRLQGAIAERVPPAVATTNPVDLGGGVTAEQLVDVVTLVAASGEVDGCIVVYVEIDGQHRLDTVESLLASGDHSVPLALARLGAGRHGSAALPTFSTPERAATALAVAARRSPWLASIAAEDDEPAEPDASSWVAVRRLARHHSASPDERRWLDPASSFELLEAAGVPIAPWTVVQSAADCADAAARLGPIVVLKADVSGESRKSAADAVRLGIGDASAAAKTYQEFAERFGSALRGVVVQSQQAAAVELLVGAVRDPAFGPLVVVGAGGVDAELRDDRVVLVAPVSRYGSTAGDRHPASCSVVARCGQSPGPRHCRRGRSRPPCQLARRHHAGGRATRPRPGARGHVWLRRRRRRRGDLGSGNDDHPGARSPGTSTPLRLVTRRVATLAGR